MKRITVLICFLLAFSVGMHAQTSSYTVGGVELEGMEVDLISVGFHRFWGTTTIAVTVSYGQNCLAEQRLSYNQRYLQSCNGLVDQAGQLVLIPDYIFGLNLFEQMGWNLEQVVPVLSEGDSNVLSHQYIFRKKRT